MADDISLRRRWRNFQPSKTILAWACIASAGLTIFVGFYWSGWMLEESAAYARTSAVNEARMDLLAATCVDRFVAAANAPVKLAELKKIGEWERRDMIKDGGWISVNSVTLPLDGEAARKCVERLMTVDLANFKVVN